MSANYPDTAYGARKLFEAIEEYFAKCSEGEEVSGPFGRRGVTVNKTMPVTPLFSDMLLSLKLRRAAWDEMLSSECLGEICESALLRLETALYRAVQLSKMPTPLAIQGLMAMLPKVYDFKSKKAGAKDLEDASSLFQEALRVIEERRSKGLSKRAQDEEDAERSRPA